METWFRLFGIPVRVNLLFFLVVFLIRPRGGEFDPVVAVLWVAMATVGILLHELGHALTVRRFGQEPSISLHSLGGLTSWSGKLSAGRRLLVSLAGPAVGIVVGCAALLARAALGLPEGSMGDNVLDDVVWVNLGWALFNLVPMLPLDGGKVMASGLELLFRERAWTAAHAASIAVALLLALLFLMARSIFGVLLCLLFTWTNVQALRAGRPRREAPATTGDR